MAAPSRGDRVKKTHSGPATMAEVFACADILGNAPVGRGSIAA